MRPVLLLIDLQGDYLDAPGLVPARGRIVERAVALLENCRAQSIPVIHIWTTVSRDDDRRMPHWKREGRWICEAGTLGHSPPDALLPRDGEVVIDKVFFSAFSNQQLKVRLAESGADTVIVAGIHLHACVRQTVLDAYEHGLEVRIAEDAVGSDDPVHAAITQRYLASRAATFVAAADCLNESNADASVSSAAAAVQCADAASRCWRETGFRVKSEMVERLAASLDREASSLADQMAREISKPVRFGRMEVIRTAELLRAIVRRLDGDFDNLASSTVTLRHRPHGVVAIITPWNNPVYIALGKVVPAILCGNTVVWKPSPYAEGVSRTLMGMLGSAGCPAGVVTLLCGGRKIAESLMNDARIAAVSLTGSSEAGFSAQAICAQRRIPLQAELGGNNASIVWHDADLSEAARQIADGAFGMAGQRCTANRRVIVHHEVKDALLTLLTEAASALAVGDPFDPATLAGPLVSVAQRNRIAALLQLCPSEWVRVIAANLKVTRVPKAWHPLAIVCCDEPDHEIVQEESFGPVLVVQTAADWDDAMRLCNGVKQGLAAALFSSSDELHQRFLNEAQAGILKINCSTADADIDVPFGGWKSSGIGPPEHGSFDLDFYTRPQTFYLPMH